MRRWFVAILLLLGSALAANWLYCHFCPRISESRCTLEWLRTQLALTPEQFARVSEIHQRRWPEIRKHQAEACGSTEEAKACKLSTQQLIQEVSEQLTPEQREKYLKLVSPCSGEGKARR